MSLSILVRGPDWLVIDKPSGMAVHKSAMAHEGPFAERVLGDQLGQKVLPVHRLDRPTSGCLLFALTSSAATRLQEALTGSTSDKRYLALVRGRWTRGPGWHTVDRPLKDDNRRLRDAHSDVRVLATSREPRCSLVEVRVFTGRYHQVRRHLNGLGHPVLGDSTHGDTRENRRWRQNHGLPRLALHAWKLHLPAEGVCVSAPVPDDLAPLLVTMPWWSDVAAQLTG